MRYETVIGLEVHTELCTKSKIFCGCTTKFGGAPNTHVCPVCAGLPGSLPVLNSEVVKFAVRAGLATNCEITRYNRFDRKNYFYPDLPKAYQISQLYLPICTNGHLFISTPNGDKKIRIREIHMEEDAGKLIHEPWEDASLADYNRCGVPLLEIVSQPDLSTADEAIAYIEALRSILQYTGVSDGKMQEGSLRADVNISVRPVGSEKLGTRTEMKNINSLRAIARAIEAETERQIDVLEDGGRIVQETRRWDDDAGESTSMRSKEDAQDYKYYPDPDLPPVALSEAFVQAVQAAMPELPVAKRERYMREFGLPAYDVGILTSNIYIMRLFERTVALCGNAKEASNWIMGEVLRLASATGVQPEAFDFSAESLGKLIVLVQKGTINRGTAKKVFAAVFAKNVDPEQYIQENNLALLTDNTAIRSAIETVVANNAKSVGEYKAGKTQALQFLIGQCMKALRGAAQAQEVTKILKELLEG